MASATTASAIAVEALGLPAALESSGAQSSTVERATGSYGTLAIPFEADDSPPTGNLIWFLFTGIVTKPFSNAAWPSECVRGNGGDGSERTRASPAPKTANVKVNVRQKQPPLTGDVILQVHIHSVLRRQKRAGCDCRLTLGSDNNVVVYRIYGTCVHTHP